MATRPNNLAMITINGEKYWPTPHEVNPALPEDMVWQQYPFDELWLSDPVWYDSIGQNAIAQRRIWAIPTESGQIEAFRQLLSDIPDRALDMMFAAAIKGKPHIIRFLLEQGVRPTADEAQGDDLTLVPLHAAAGNGHLDCVKIFVEEAGLSVNALHDLGGTPLMNACWKAGSLEVVRYLISKGVDITIRQKALRSGEQGASAFEFAVGGGNVDCANAIIEKTKELGIDTSTLATPVALAAAAQSDRPLEMLDLVFLIGGYPLKKPDGNWEGDISSLTDSMKESVEGALVRALYQRQWKSLKPLFAYIDSQKEDGSHHWQSMKPGTMEDLAYAILDTVKHDDKDHQDVFEYLYNIALHPGSRFTTVDLQEKKKHILGDAFFRACEHGSMEMLRFLSSKHDINANHLSRYVKPLFSSSLYAAASSGHNDVVEYLFLYYGERLDIHKGVGKFVNGPTALWISVWNGHESTVDILLRHGGPVESIDETIMAGTTPGNVIVTARKAFRSPVDLISETAWTREHGALDEAATRGVVHNNEGDEIRYVVLKKKSLDPQQLRRVEIRLSDDNLKLMELDSRELK